MEQNTGTEQGSLYNIIIISIKICSIVLWKSKTSKNNKIANKNAKITQNKEKQHKIKSITCQKNIVKKIKNEAMFASKMKIMEQYLFLIIIILYKESCSVPVFCST